MASRRLILIITKNIIAVNIIYMAVTFRGERDMTCRCYNINVLKRAAARRKGKAMDHKKELENWAKECVNNQIQAITELEKLCIIYEDRNDFNNAGWCYSQIAKHYEMIAGWYDFIERFCNEDCNK